jgi:glutamate transport system permease protein
MSIITEFHGLLLDAFRTTLLLSLASGALALVIGVLLAVARVSPVPTLRWIGAAYVGTIRNTPLTVVFFVIVFVLPQIDLVLPGFLVCAITALSLYTAAFVCEAVRSGINTVGRGQAEASRALGVPFLMGMRHVVVPQALRAVVPPMASVWIALVKNTSVAAGFSVLELSAAGQRINFLAPAQVLPALLWIAVAYLVITLGSAACFRILEGRLATA